MKRRFAVGLFLLVVTLSLFCVSSSKAQSYGTIYIHSDGSISPSNAPIQLEGNVYRLQNDVYSSPIVLERNHMVFDGEGYSLEGAGTDVALNVTCSDTTIMNLVVQNWDAGILGAYDNVTIQNCNVTGCGKGIAIYADDYRVLGNYIAGNEWGIRLQGSNAAISNNMLVGNGIGVWLTSSYEGRNGVAITDNTFETKGKSALETDLDGGFQVYHNNFVLPPNQGAVIVTAYLVIPGDETQVVMTPWDNGVEGNYWSDYSAKYPNASEVGTTGVYDTPYVINIAPNLTDRYPLVQEVAVPQVILPVPSSTASPTSSATPTPSLASTQSPSESSPIPSSSETPAGSDQPTQSPQWQSEGVPVELLAALGVFVLVIALAVAFLVLRRRG